MAKDKEYRGQLRQPIPGYCYDIDLDGYQDCTKIVSGMCSVYIKPCSKVGASGNIGCSFSPLEQTVQTIAQKMRAGQQKGKKGKKEDRWSYNRGRKARRARLG